LKGLRVLELANALNAEVADVLAVCAILKFNSSTRLSMLTFDECKKISEYYEEKGLGK